MRKPAPKLLDTQCDSGSLVDRGRTFQPIEPGHVSSSAAHSCAPVTLMSLAQKNDSESCRTTLRAVLSAFYLFSLKKRKVLWGHFFAADGSEKS